MKLHARPLPGRTLAMLETAHPLLFRQCEMIFGRGRAGYIVLAVHRRLWPV